VCVCACEDGGRSHEVYGENKSGGRYKVEKEVEGKELYCSYDLTYLTIRFHRRLLCGNVNTTNNAFS